MKINLKSLLFYTLVPLMIAFIITMLVPDYKNYYESLKKPFEIPPIVFSIVWPVLYILIGISGYLIEQKEEKEKSESNHLIVYYVSLGLNLIYTIIAFWVRSIIFATIDILLVLTLSIIVLINFYKYKKASAYLLIPYILWLIIATYLQVGIYFMN